MPLGLLLIEASKRDRDATDVKGKEMEKCSSSGVVATREQGEAPHPLNFRLSIIAEKLSFSREKIARKGKI